MLSAEIDRRLQDTTTRYYGKYRGVVFDNDDTQNLGRIRATVREVLGSVPTGWAYPCMPLSGDGFGMFTIPPKKAGVWIEFESGKVSKPIWSGCWWPSGKLPKDQAGTAATPDIKILRSAKGLLVALNDADQTIAVSDGDGNNLFHVDVQKGTLTVQAQTKVIVEAPQIELVRNASHPVPFGDSLLQYLQTIVQIFNAHVHPGELAAGFIPVTPAPPVAMMSPPAPSLLSTTVKTG
jgi:hypothetical protein